MTVSDTPAAEPPAAAPAASDAASTEVVAVEPAPAATAPAEPPAPRKRRGWIVALVIVGVLVVLAIVGFFVADAIAKQYARDYVRERVVEVLKLPQDAAVDVDLGGGSIILQALSGRVATVDVDVPEVAFGELTGAVRLRAEGVPLDAAAPVEALRVDFAMGEDDLAALNAGEGEPAPDAPAFEFGADGAATLSTEFDLFGGTVPLSFSLVPSAAEGDLVLTPTRLTIGDATFEAGEDDGSFLGAIAAALLQPQTLCIAGSVPQALVLADAEITGGELVLTFRGDGEALGGAGFATSGTCPED